MAAARLAFSPPSVCKPLVGADDEAGSAHDEEEQFHSLSLSLSSFSVFFAAQLSERARESAASLSFEAAASDRFYLRFYGRSSEEERRDTLTKYLLQITLALSLVGVNVARRSPPFGREGERPRREPWI